MNKIRIKWILVLIIFMICFILTIFISLWFILGMSIIAGYSIGTAERLETEMSKVVGKR